MYTFGKQEHLCSQKWIDQLFHSGHKFVVFPFRVHWMLCPTDQLPNNVRAQVLIATSKRKFRHAVDRNRVKRLTRESYRLRKPQLYDFLSGKGISLLLSINYIHTEILGWDSLQRKFDKLIGTLLSDIERSLPDSTCET